MVVVEVGCEEEDEVEEEEGEIGGEGPYVIEEILEGLNVM